MIHWRAWLSGVLRGQSGRELKELGVKELLTIEDLAAALERSEHGPVALFKHSTRCPISAAAYRQVEAYLAGNSGGAFPFYLVKVIEARPVSNAIADRLGVSHQSPQLIFVKCKQAYWTQSHGGITAAAIESAAKTPTP